MQEKFLKHNFQNGCQIVQVLPANYQNRAGSACMLCGVRFHPIMSPRHHCQFCGGIFCGECSKGRSLLPEKFGAGDLQRAGGELTDFVIAVRRDAVKTFSGNAHISVAAGMSAAVGVIGRALEADVRAGDGSYAACHTYNCSKCIS